MEIAKMGAAAVSHIQAHSPKLSLKIVDSESTPTERIFFSYKNYCSPNYSTPEDDYPDYEIQRVPRDKYSIGLASHMSLTNKRYYRELASYIQQTAGRYHFRLQLTNAGDHFADDVRIYVSMETDEKRVPLTIEDLNKF
jgi:hypothetical protein